MRDPKLLLLLSQSLIGTGFFFIYVHHIRSIFESRTNIAHLTQLERESLVRNEDALYYSFYKTLTEEPDFWSGYEQLKNVTGIEYPHSVNVLQRFDVLPELTIAYLYQLVRPYIHSGHFPFLSCWRSNDIRLAMEERRCDPMGQSMQFYLEFVWLLGGVTVLIIYIYGTLLSENIFGGIYAVVSYVMFHSYAAKIYERPMARENFAFPVIFLQMFYLCVCIDRVTDLRSHRSRLLITLKLTALTAVSLLCWQFTAIIFATQILIMMTPWWWSLSTGGSTASSVVPTAVSSAFTIDYALSQIAGNVLAYYLSHGNKRYIFAWQIGPAIGLLFVSIVRRFKQQQTTTTTTSSSTYEYSLKMVALGILMAVSAQGTIIDLLEKTGVARSADNSFALYRDLIVHWTLQAKVNFGTSLAACNPAYARVAFADLWELLKTLIVKPYCMYGVVMLAKFFRKWRKSGEQRAPPSSDLVERAKKYVLEDFLEENRVSIPDMSNAATETELNECLRLLEACDYDYERYKREKSQRSTEKPDEHSAFINDIRKLKEQISVLNDKRNKDNAGATATAGPADDNGAVNNASKSVEDKLEEEDQDKPQQEEDSAKSAETNTNTKPSKSAEDTNTKSNDASSSSSSNGGRRTRVKRGAASNNQSKPAAAATAPPATTPPAASPLYPGSTTSEAAAAVKQGDFFSFHYLYSFIQMAVFTVIGLSIKKLFFLSFTQGCVIAPTICSKFWYRKQRNIFWTVSLAVFLTSMFDPGMMNIREEYFPTRYSHGSDDLDTMLEWIKMNTERDAVFAGPIEIIGTVHMTTKRPIVNHAHLEMRHISDRTEHVYSVFSRQQSSDIYNQCSQLKIQYLIISMGDCSNEINDDCDMLSIWDDMQPSYRKYPQFCSELANKNIPSFLKVFSNDYYGIIKMFSQSVQINLKYSKMPEKVM